MAHQLDRRKKEKHLQHRALLLWAMQHPDKRSLRAVARAIARPESTLRGWMRTKNWAGRGSDPDSEDMAIVIYRRLYLKEWGKIEIPEVQQFVVVPLSTTIKGDPPPSDVVDDIRKAETVVQQEILRRGKNKDTLRDKHVDLVDGALGYVVQEMKGKRIRATLRDIPTLLEARAHLTGDGSAEGAAATETVRVRSTRVAGGDVIEAMWEDIEELQVIVGALRTRQADAVEKAAPTLTLVDGPGDGDDAS